MILALRAVWLKYRIFWIIGILASIMTLVSYITHQYKEGQFALKEQKLNEKYLEELLNRQTEYEAKVDELNAAALRKQEELSNLNTELERKFHESKKKSDEVSRKYDRLVRNGYRLRYNQTNTNSVQMCGTTKNPDSRTTNSGDTTSSIGELPEEITRDLLRLATDADRVVEQLKLTQEYAKELRMRCGNNQP